VDGLRLALGESERDRIPPHLTLVPPVNVREDRMDAAHALLRDAAAATKPLRLTLGPPRTFLPDSPVLYLGVHGDVDELLGLREAIFKEPLQRPLSWPFVPHVTIVDGVQPYRIQAGMTALESFEREVVFEAVHLLEETEGHTWRVIAEAPFVPAATVARGAPGVELDLATTDRLGDETRRWLTREWPDDQRPLAVTARRDGEVVGVATGWTNGDLANLGELFVAPQARKQGVAGHVVAAFLSAAAERGAHRCRLRTDDATPAHAFYVSRGWREEARYPGPSEGVAIVQLVRDL
jgi:2'-5' RNA ligase/predicted N-acetyltransferase YhbS